MLTRSDYDELAKTIDVNNLSLGTNRIHGEIARLIKWCVANAYEEALYGMNPLYELEIDSALSIPDRPRIKLMKTLQSKMEKLRQEITQ